MCTSSHSIIADSVRKAPVNQLSDAVPLGMANQLTCNSCCTEGRAAVLKLRHCDNTCCNHPGKESGTTGGRCLIMAVSI